MVAPAAAQLGADFGITNSAILAMTISVFVLAYAFGPLFLGPLSELYGRSRVLQLANLFFLIFNIAAGFAQTSGQLIAFRFLSGLGGSAPLAIGGGVLGDCWHPEQRGKAIAVYSLAPLLGPVVGPVAGAWIATKSTWRWVFWSTSIVDALVQCAGIIWLQETFAPVLLERKAAAIRKERGIDKDDFHTVRTPFQNEDRHWKRIFAKALTRPFVLWAREPIVQLLGVYMAFIYGLMYLKLTTIPQIYTGVYHESVGIGGLHYIALGMGLSVASQVNARILDKVYIYYKNRAGGVGRPEFRLPSMIPGTILLPIGLFMTGWGTEKHVHWILPDIGLAFIGAGVILNFQGIQTYVIDAFTLHAASALAATSFLRSVCGFGFPLFAPAMYNKLGYGVGDTVLAALAIVIGCPAPWIFWKYGERIRLRSKYSSASAKKTNPPQTKA
ncbi:MFS general substrate transporter [Sistotremastrum suecicum HHB10207 ss-3]|nr:MFS general substrate transporter [Sistotremastrum suecicum HHB10207 ss-3]